MNEENKTDKIILTGTNDFMLEVNSKYEFVEGDTILENFKDSPIIPMSFF